MNRKPRSQRRIALLQFEPLECRANPAVPIFTTPSTGAVAENTAGVFFNVGATDPDGTGVTYSITGGEDQLDFSMNASTGEVSFLAPPNFESPIDVGSNNVYEFEVTAVDAAEEESQQAIFITVTNVNEAPTITSNGGDPTATVSVDENEVAVTSVTVFDPDARDTVAFSLSGPDAAVFSISAGGSLRFLAAPNFEAPADAGLDNNYDVTVTATDSGSLTGSQDITVAVQAVDEPPTFTSLPTASVPENSPPGEVRNVVATDPEGSAVLYAISGGADQALFSIDGATGALTFVAAQNFEAPADVNADNIYEVTVTATDATANSASQDITLGVTNVNEPPVITSNGGGATASLSRAENGTAVTTVTSADPDAGATRSYSLTGGPDEAAFFIDASTGVLTFLAAPNFESPADSNGDNTYEVVVQVSDGLGGTESQAITVTVTNANDAPTLNASIVAIGSIDEDATNNNGVLVASFARASLISDADAGASRGIAITTAPTVGGKWQFSTDNGANWLDVGAVSRSHARLLAADSTTRVRWLPAHDIAGLATFAFRAWDGSNHGRNGGTGNASVSGGGSSYSATTATARLTVRAVNDSPTLSVPANVTLTRNSSFTFTGNRVITAADLDAGSGVVRVTLTTTRGHFALTNGSGLSSYTGNNTATLVLNGTLAAINTALTRVRFDVQAGYVGRTNLTITLSDLGNTGIGGAKTATRTVAVTVIDRAPIARSPLSSFTGYVVGFNGTLTTTASSGVLRAFTDPDRDSLTAVLVTPPTGGTFTLRTDGGFTYHPPAGFRGRVTFVARADDGALLSAPVTFSIQVG